MILYVPIRDIQAIQIYPNVIWFCIPYPMICPWSPKSTGLEFCKFSMKSRLTPVSHGSQNKVWHSHFPSKNGAILMVNWYWRQFLIPKRTLQKKWNGSKTVSFAIKGNGTPYQGWCNHCKESHCDRHVFFLYFPCILVSNLHYSVPNTSASNLKGLFLGEVGF